MGRCGLVTGRGSESTCERQPRGTPSLLVRFFAVDAWEFLDAKGRQESGDDAVASVGPVTLPEPGHWLIGCIVLWIFVVALYLVAKRA